MKNKNVLTSILLFLFLTFDLFAIEGSVKVYVKNNDTVYTSQKVIVAVELLTDAFSISDAKITFPTSSKYIVQVPKSADYLRTEDINGRDWQLVHYEYVLYPLRAGEIDIPSLPITFSASMGYGQLKKEFSFKTDALSIMVQSPEGVKAETFVLVTNTYSLKSEMKPEKKQLIVGDALTFSITQKANDVPDILLKPFVYKSNDKLRVYDKEPELKSGLKGDFDVSRTDSFTFVANSEGNVTLPEKTFVWWNNQTKKLEVEKIDAISFIIIEDPQIAIDERNKKRNEILFSLVSGSILLLGLYLIFREKIHKYIALRRHRYEESEKGKFDHLLKSIDKGNPSEVYGCYHDWLGVMGNKDKIEQYIENNNEIKNNVLAFETSLVSRAVFDKQAFSQTVYDLRKIYINSSENAQNMLVKQLNP